MADTQRIFSQWQKLQVGVDLQIFTTSDQILNK